MKGLVLDPKWEPKPDYAVSDWEKETGKAINGKVVQVGRAAQKVPMYLETFQGRSGHANFSSVIRLVSSRWLDLSPIITAHYQLAKAVDAVAKSTVRVDGKIMLHPI